MRREDETLLTRDTTTDTVFAVTEIAALGDSAAARSALDRSQRTAGPVWVEYMGIFVHAYDLVRQGPRFTALVRQANLDPGRLDTSRRGR